MESSKFPMKGVAGDTSRKKAGDGTRWLLTNLPEIENLFYHIVKKKSV